MDTDPALEPLYVSISDVARLTNDSEWVVKDLLRRGTYKAKKSGRRTIIDLASVKARLANLPDAQFAPPRAKATKDPGRAAGPSCADGSDKLFESSAHPDRFARPP